MADDVGAVTPPVRTVIVASELQHPVVLGACRPLQPKDIQKAVLGVLRDLGQRWTPSRIPAGQLASRLPTAVPAVGQSDDHRSRRQRQQLELPNLGMGNVDVPLHHGKQSLKGLCHCRIQHLSGTLPGGRIRRRYLKPGNRWGGTG
jgi:hypothetical protein